jgi:hypothetical protein
VVKGIEEKETSQDGYRTDDGMDKNFLFQAWSIGKLGLRVKIKNLRSAMQSIQIDSWAAYTLSLLLQSPPLEFEGLCLGELP